MIDQRDPDNPIADTYVFDLEMSEKGRRVNRLAE
jgi:hypothetical protein